ncbi:acyl-CoA dehydrogenase family protein [Planomonospora venezuelensis]|uniref:Dibenzothiophene monooxygenase n=1 Tax=Planomonospora venezuelensis TaxID=1999 RepID=A0A841DE03_PLAVE|nr:acyl-CoA dehydrogenase family protein [Planomonospora venezuelensis]MBB5966528.1 alkylation response protein AidB-like acyl-CoA dehydrogenase [Planomonospora venezuelensis]GIN02294.1 SfnB family sulfur acquisition oxidoreductase [Planomonospora venezuelensis]
MIGERLVEDMTDAERERAARVETVLPALREAAGEADLLAAFPAGHVGLLREAGLLGLVVPEKYGGLGGTLRDLAAATYAMGTACPSTALAYFFHNTSASRGLLPLEAIDAGLFGEEEIPPVRAFAEKVLTRMADGAWLANFASESVKSSTANITIATTARRAEGGWVLDGEKSFGCATGVADHYLTTARLDGYDTAEGLATFFVPRDAAGVSVRDAWDGLGMRATANNGIRLAGVFVPDDEALTVPGAFTRMLRMSRGSFVGNQLAIAAVYAGCAQNVYDHTIEATTRRTFADTGRPIASSPVHQQLIGEMTQQLETAYLWLRHQLDLETGDPPRRPKQEVFKQWRLGKGSVTEACFQVALGAFKAGGTSGAMMGGVVGRALRDLAMGLVMTFPAERGRLEAAQIVTSAKENELFATAPARPSREDS